MTKTCWYLARGLALIVAALPISGCADLLPFPGFGGPLSLGNWTQNIPVSAVVTQVRCELDEFFREPLESNLNLDRKKFASMSLKLQTDMAGYVNYTGIDLAKVGLNSLGQLIAANNKVPSLQAKVSAKSTVTAQADMTVPQKPQVSADCPTIIQSLPKRLFLRDWLVSFFQNNTVYSTNTSMQGVCLSKVTLGTQFQIAADVSAGVNPLPGTVFILPISGLTGDFNPTLTHSLTLVFVLKDKNNATECASRTTPTNPAPQPNVTLF